MENAHKTDTKWRILCAARNAFAEHGPANARIRDICERAQANVAAVNYHFGNKDKLYVAVLRDYLLRKLERHPHDTDVTSDSPPRERLRVFIRSLLAQFLNDDDAVSEKLGRLLTQEFIDPSSEYSSSLLEEQILPLHRLLLQILREMLPHASDREVARCALNIVGQCLHSCLAPKALRFQAPELALAPANLDAVTSFILDFSLGGIERLNGRQPA